MMENIKPKETKKSVKSKSTSALPKNQPRSKKDNYKFVSKTSLLQDFRSTASSSFSGMKQKLTSLTNILKPTSKGKMSDANYGTLNEQPTPVKMYSPFTFESPAPTKTLQSEEEKKKLRLQLFNTPTQKTQEDIDNLGSGMTDLWRVTSRIEQSYTNPATCNLLNDESIPEATSTEENSHCESDGLNVSLL